MISETGNDRSAIAGITLIEVLIATVILFAGLGAVLGGYAMATRALDEVMDALAAGEILREKAVAIELQKAACSPLTAMADRQAVGGRVYEWAAMGGVPDGKGGIQEVMVAVWRSSRPGRYKLATQWAEAGASKGESSR
jgi:hypothetical protein